MGSSFVAKIIATLCTVAQVPIALRHLGKEHFGIWVTLTSVLGMMSFTDLGLGFGLQNCMAEAYGKDDPVLTKRIYFTGFCLLTVIATVMTCIGVSIIPMFPWEDFFKIHDAVLRTEIKPALTLVVCIFCVGLPLTSAQRLASAHQWGWMQNIWLAVGSILSLILIATASLLKFHFLTFLAFATIPPVLVNLGLLGQLLLRLGWLTDGHGFFATNYIYRLLTTGIGFLLPQIASTTLNTVPTVVISSVLGAAALTPYNLTQRLLVYLFQIQMLTIAPLWPAYSEAKARNDTAWIRATFQRCLRLAPLFLLPIILFAFFGRTVIFLWTRSPSSIPSYPLLWWLSGWTILLMLGQPCAYLLNGLGRLKGQSTYILASCCIALAIMPMFARRFGDYGVPMALVLSYLPLALPLMYWESFYGIHCLERSHSSSQPPEPALATQ